MFYIGIKIFNNWKNIPIKIVSFTKFGRCSSPMNEWMKSDGDFENTFVWTVQKCQTEKAQYGYKALIGYSKRCMRWRKGGTQKRGGRDKEK